MLRIESVGLPVRRVAVRREIAALLRAGHSGLAALDEAVELTRVALFAGLDDEARLERAEEVLDGHDRQA